jgi:chorismate mutase
MDKISSLREKIDVIDDQIFKLLYERVEVCKAIGEAKKKQGLAVKDSSRENQVYKHVKEKSAQFRLDSSHVEAVYREIVNMCSAVQNTES